MNEIQPSPWACIKCRKRAKTYADGVVFCEGCQKKLQDAEKIDISRGRQKNTPSPEWTKLRVD
jgi:predicted amidophosphoribosyltransferase